MKGAFVGDVMAVELAQDRDTGEAIHWVTVALGDFPVRIACSAAVTFNRLDQVLVQGDVRQFKEKLYLKGGTVRLASRSDILVVEGDGVPGDTGASQGAAGKSADTLVGSSSGRTTKGGAGV